MTPSMPNELYDKKSLFTLGGASLGVWLFTNVIGYIFLVDMQGYRWVGLLVAMTLSFIGAIQIRKMDLNLGVIAFFNGLLIFVSASGINSINQGIDISENSQQARSALIPFTDGQNWWIPTDVLKESTLLSNQVKDLSQQLKIKDKELYQSTEKMNQLMEQGNNQASQFPCNDEDLKSKIEELLRQVKNKDEIIQQLKSNLSSQATYSSNGSTVETDCKIDLKSAHESVTDLLSLNQRLLKSLEEYKNTGSMKPLEQRNILEIVNEKVNTLNNDVKDYNKNLNKIKSKIESKL